MRRSRCPQVTVHVSYVGARRPRRSAALGRPRPERKKPSAAAIDDVLHRERLSHGRKLIHVVSLPLAELPDGAVIVSSGAAYVVAGGRAFRWTERGYEPPEKIARADGLLTPPSTLKALQAGYRPIIHPTIESLIGRTPS
jgi:hypothetical protein